MPLQETSDEIRAIGPEKYPTQLRELPDMPKKLWLRGNLPPEAFRLLAVVGSRALSRYGREACALLVKGLSGYPISIVSGLAIGADACAHQAALEAGLHTIAIPGSGLAESVLYPRQNRYLAQEILTKGGALLSEHEPSYHPRTYDFPSRNRIMAGLCHAVLIVEAGPQSGTLITARLAMEYNREVLCIPHRITDPHSFGASKYISDGAKYVSGVLDILEALQIPPREEDILAGFTGLGAATEMSGTKVREAISKLSSDEKKLYALLEIPRSRDAIIRESGLPVQKVLVLLVTLELKGLAREESGEWKRARGI